MGVETTIVAALMGLSLASASGFRVFLPPFLLSIAVRTDTLVSLDLSDTGFAVFDSNAAVLILGIACIAEFGAYYVPWLDNLLGGFDIRDSMYCRVWSILCSLAG